jgi:hypothetical protein
MHKYLNLHNIPLYHRSSEMVFKVSPSFRTPPHQFRVKPISHRVYIIHGQSNSPLNQLAKRRHLRALEYYSTNVIVLRNQTFSCIYHLLFDISKAARALHPDESLQMAPIRSTADAAAGRRRLRNAQALKIERAKLVDVVRNDANLLVRGQPSEDRRDLNQRRGGDWDRKPGGETCSVSYG